MATCTGDRQVPVWAWIGFVLSCCFFSGIIGDVPDGVVYTDLHKTVQLGDRVVLKCQFLGTPLAVYWKKGNDPTIKQSLMSWFGDEPLAGTCVSDKTCEMGDDFSLIIKNISIADQNRYICRVASYKGILIYNVTDVELFALPEEPYPVINECKNLSAIMLQDCQVSSLTPVNITCTSMGYFPSMDLFFLHGKQQFETTDTLEWTNTDGTKSKSISTTAPPSEKPYVCVAFNIPGSREQRTATITVTRQDDATHSSRLSVTSQIVTIAVVCVLAGIVLFFTMFTIYRKRRRGRKKRKHGHDGTNEEATPLLQGPVSSYELWHLVSYKKTEDHKRKLLNMFRQLGISDIKEKQLTPLAAYQTLCTWRDSKDEGEQLLALKKALEDIQYDEAWNDMFEKRNNTSIRVSEKTFKHILLQMGNTDDVNKFIRELIRGQKVISGGMELVIQTALRDLKKWSRPNNRFDINPFVSLSFASERGGCKAEDIVHFWVPSELQTPPEETQVDAFITKLTGRHCRRLAVALKISDDQTEYFVLENNFRLFDTKSMITAFLDDKACSNYEKRCRLDDAVIKAGRYDLQDHFDTVSYRQDAGFQGERPHPKYYLFDNESIFDDDIHQLVKLVRCLPSEKKAQFYIEIKLDSRDNADDDNIIKEKMKKWRDGNMTTLPKVQLSEKFRSFRKDLTNTDYSECTETKSTTKRVTRAELPRIALDLLMEDVRPIIKALCIDQKTVSKYYRQSDGKGTSTIDLVMKLLNSGAKSLGILGTSELNREDFCKALRKVGFIDVARSVYFGRYETESQKGSRSVWDMPGE